MKMARLLPNSLAARFTILLAVALIVANAVAFFILSLERNRELRDFRRNSQIEQLVILVPALNALDPKLRQDVVRASSGRRLRLRLAERPLVDAGSLNGISSEKLAEQMGQSLDLPPGTEIRVQTSENQASENQSNDRRRRNSRARSIVEIAIPLLDGTWLNARQTSFVPRPFIYTRGTWLPILFTLLGVLAVGLWFIRRLTKPLRELASAASRVGRGDRSKPLDESGAAEFKNTAHAFNIMQEDIDRFDVERARTIAAVGHDLRTPITSLRLRAEMVEDDELRQPMIRTLDDMKVMADELLHWGKSEKDVEPFQSVDLSELLSRLCEQTKVQFIPSAPLLVSGRPVALRRAFSNIIDNTSRYASSGTAKVESKDGKAVVTFEDSGPGISMNQLATIFDPFTRGDASRSKDSGGAGLGLSIAKAVIEVHNGTISLNNRAEANGTIVVVKLPVNIPKN